MARLGVCAAILCKHKSSAQYIRRSGLPFMRTPVAGATVANALTPSNEGTKCHVLVGGKLVAAPNAWIAPHSPPGLPLRG
jgi:hypothetical protein